MLLATQDLNARSATSSETALPLAISITIDQVNTQEVGNRRTTTDVSHHLVEESIIPTVRFMTAAENLHVAHDHKDVIMDNSGRTKLLEEHDRSGKWKVEKELHFGWCYTLDH